MLTILIWVLLAGTALPLFWLWRTADSRRSTRVGLCILWASFLWLLIGTAYAPAVGPNYSQTRLVLINANIATVIFVGGFLFFRDGAKLATVVGTGWLAFGWLYLRAVSFVV